MAYSGKNIGLSSYDDLFKTDEGRNTDEIKMIAISELHPFEQQPFKVLMDESMDELVESIKERGLIQPVIIRPVENGMYEMVSGHRRKRAFEIAGYEKIPARVKEMSRDEAILSMVDSNLQRETVLPSEKARAYKMRLDAMKRQGKRTDLTLSPTGTKLRSDQQLADEVGESRNQIQRLIRLNYLVPEMLDLVDEGKVAMRPAVEISYLPEEIQYDLLEAMEYNEATPSHDQTIRMRKAYQEGKLTTEVVENIMEEPKPNQKEKSPFRDKRIEGAIPKGIPKEKYCDFVIKAIEFYNRYLERVKENRSR